jgi:aryl-alcohol dehydrogenase-like predicted oxidoreductase
MDSLTHVSTRALGSSGLLVPAVGLGCMGFSQGYGEADDAESIATIRRAIDLGAGLLDTAMSYGAGHNEELVGRAISGRRDEVVLYSPLGRGFLAGSVSDTVFGDGDFRRRDPRFSGAALTRNQAALDAVAKLAARRGISPGQLALAWLLAQGDDVVAIPGTRRQHRIDENVAAAAAGLSAADLGQIEQTAPRRAWAGDRQSFAARHPVRTS